MELGGWEEGFVDRGGPGAGGEDEACAGDCVGFWGGGGGCYFDCLEGVCGGFGEGVGVGGLVEVDAAGEAGGKEEVAEAEGVARVV